MRTSAGVISKTSPESAMEELEKFLSDRRSTRKAVENLAEFERELHKKVAAVECEAIGEELKKFDLDVPAVEISGRSYRQVLRSAETYICNGGEIRVERSLYRAENGERAVSVMELRAGIVEGIWTPLAAEIGAWIVAHLTPKEGEELLARIGGMSPSRSSLDRLVTGVGKQWESSRNRWEPVIATIEPVPAQAVSAAVSLDGVMIPMRDGERSEKRAAQRAAGKQESGSAGYGEASCGTLSFYDREGELISTLRMARMPESGKVTLKQMLTREVEIVKKQRPDLRLVGLADGAKDNWTYLDSLLPAAEKILDFYHSAEHLKAALDKAYGEASKDASSAFEKLRHKLRHQDNGVDSVIRALIHLRDRFPLRKVIARELAFFRRNRNRMRYKQMADSGLPIGSGIVEAACKTLVTQRLKRSGMRWRNPGGQAVLSLRSLIQSDRFDIGWDLLILSYKATVSLPTNVLSFANSSTRLSV